jgi:hypothetical protein
MEVTQIVMSPFSPGELAPSPWSQQFMQVLSFIWFWGDRVNGGSSETVESSVSVWPGLSFFAWVARPKILSWPEPRLHGWAGIGLEY